MSNILTHLTLPGDVQREIVDEKSRNAVMIQSTQPTEDGNKIWINSENGQEIQFPTWEEFQQKANKTRIDFDGTNFKIGEKVLTYKELHDVHLIQPDFAFVVYGDRAYLLSYVQDDTNAMREMRFQSVIAVTASDNTSNVKVSGIYVKSSDGVNFAGTPTIVDVNSENKAYKATEINDSNKNSNIWYPSVKAVADKIDPIAEDVTQLKSDYAELDSRLSESINAISENYFSFGQIVEIEVTPQNNKIFDNTTYSTKTFNSFNTATINVLQGEKYLISGYGGDGQYAPCFGTETSVVQVVEPMVNPFTDYEVIVPNGATKLNINGRPAMGTEIVVKKVSGNKKSDEFMKEFNDVKDSIKDSGKIGVSVATNGDIDVFVRGYDTGRDFCVSFWEKASNRLPDIGSICSYPNEGKTVLVNKAGLTAREISGGSTDFLSPSVVYAVNNADGDFPTMIGGKLTGGWHGYNSATSGATATARNVSCKVFCDAKEIRPGETSIGDSAIIYIVNRLQGSNTEKQDGSGREIVEQRFRITIKDDFTVCVEGEIIPLEDIKYSTYYGVSCYHNMPNDVYFVGCRSKRNGQPKSGTNRCGDLYCTSIKQTGENDVLEMGYDNTYDLGLQYANKWTNSFTMSNSKSYAVLIYGEGNNMLSLNEGDIVRWKGFYKCYPNK